MHARTSTGINPAALDIALGARAASRKVRERQDANDASIAKALADLDAVVNKILDRQRALEALDAGKAKALADVDAAINKILDKQKALEDRQKSLEQQFTATPR